MDISFLTKDDIEAIRKTIADHYIFLGRSICPCPSIFYEGWNCDKCKRLFPKIKKGDARYTCPCNVYSLSYVIKRARYFVKLWEDEHAKT